MIDAFSMHWSVSAAAASARRCFGFIGCMTALSCGTDAQPGAANASVQGVKFDSGSGGSSLSLGSGGSAGLGSTGAGGTFDAGTPPIVACGPGSDASADSPDGAACAPPLSHCLDERTLAYYTDGRCVDGRCVWAPQLLTCRTLCDADGCRNNVTAISR